MLTHGIFGRIEHLVLWREYHGPLTALVVALILALAGRFWKSGVLSLVAGGAGVLAGWYALSAAPFSLAPRLLPDRLPLVAAGSLAIGLLATRLTLRTGPWPGLILAALASGWWLGGAPFTQARLMATWPVLAGVTGAVLAMGWLSAGPTADRLRPALAACTLAASLHLAGAPWAWIPLALVPALASLPVALLPRGMPAGALPLAVDVAALGSAAVLALGRLPRGGVKAIDLAALSPLLALWLLPLVTPRLRLAGRMAPVLAALLCGGLAAGIVWGAVRFRLV